MTMASSFTSASLLGDGEAWESFNLPEVAPTMSNAYVAEDLGYFKMSLVILEILERFGTHLTQEPPYRLQSRWIGKVDFLPHVFHHVRRHERVQLTMPAFPCKSANRNDKVLGHLPDLGEELGLCRLNDIAVAIGKVYQPGACVNIASDGVLFNDIIGVSDEETWEYGEELRAIMARKGLDHLRFIRPQTLLGMIPESDMTRERYIATADDCRALLEARYASSMEQIENAIISDPDTNRTYCGMAKFLETELSGPLAGKSYRERKIRRKEAAKKMMQRSEAFTLAIRSLRPVDVRLSMHASSGAAKLSVALVPSPDGMFQKSPWHSCVAVDKHGAYRCVHSEEVRHTHRLVHQWGRPYFYVAMTED